MGRFFITQHHIITYHTQYNNIIRTHQHYQGVEEAGANDRALVERRDDDDDNERHLANFEKSSPVENYRPSVGPGVAKRPGVCGGLSRESAGVVPARERQDTKFGTRSRFNVRYYPRDARRAFEPVLHGREKVKTMYKLSPTENVLGAKEWDE